MKLSNQYRVANLSKMTLSPEYSWVHSSRRVALEKELYEDAMSKFHTDLPFTNIFGRGATRLVVPMVNTMKYKISELLNKQGYSSVDWIKGEALKPIPPHPDAPQPPPGSPPKVQKTKIGKVLGRLPEAKDLLNWWSANQEAAKSDDYSIVVSRHPVDVLRMSDHKSWHSCHSPDGGWFASCVGEMQHGGLIAYLVSTSHLQQLSPKQISGNQEIFKDEDRGVDGVKPVSRLRLRRFTHKRDNFDLAVPEWSVYGQFSSEFRTQVEDWARKAQEPVLEGKRPRLHEFTRRGGAYKNEGVDDSSWFNNFFQDYLDHGNTDFGIYGEEEEDEPEPDDEDEELYGDDEYDAENARQEAENERQGEAAAEYHRRWERRLDHCTISYEEEYDEDGDIYFSWEGAVDVEMPLDMFKGSNFIAIDDLLNTGENSLVKYLYKNEFDNGGGRIRVNQRNYGVEFSIDIMVRHGMSGDADDYDTFCDSLNDDFDGQYERLRGLIIQWLVKNELAQMTPMRQFDYSNVQFQNFEVEFNLEEGEMEAIAEDSIGMYKETIWSEPRFRDQANTAIRALVAQELERIIRMKNNPAPHLPGFEFEEPNAGMEDYNLNNFSVYLNKTEHHRPQIALAIKFVADDMTDEEDFQDAVGLMRVVDQVFPRIISECMRLLENFYIEREQALNAIDETITQAP